MHPIKPLTIFFSAGEPSGDLHGANLIRQLQARQPGLVAVGYGGPKMAEAGCLLHADLTALAVMWFARVLLNLHKFWGLVSRADRYFRHHRPDAVVLIDYPGMNWWIARRAKVHGIPVFYYSPPQIWAWGRWRVKKMRRLVDHVLCGLPFEEAWFRGHGCNATFVGHPFFDEVRRYPYDEAFMAAHRNQSASLTTVGQTFLSASKPSTDRADKNVCPTGQCAVMGPLVAILPGSRTQEVTKNLRWFLKAAALIHQQMPDVRFALAAFKPRQAELARPMVEATGLPIEICVGKTPELMRLADCAMSVSGSVSLELLYHTTPTVILYWIDRFAYFVQSRFRKVKYITLVNLIATGELESEGQGTRGEGRGTGSDGRGLGTSVPSAAGSREGSGFTVQGSGSANLRSKMGNPKSETALFPEYLTCEDKSPEIAGHIIEWLSDPAKRAARIEALAELKARVAHGGASDRAAGIYTGKDEG